MYMYIRSPPVSSGGRSRRDCCLRNNSCCNNFVEQTVIPTRTKKSLFASAYTKDLGYTKVSRGLRQSALLCSPTCRRVLGCNGYYQKVFHVQETCSSACSGHCRACRCLGWGEEEEEKEEKDECLTICEVGGEDQEILNLLIEESVRRDLVLDRRESPKSSRLGRILKEKSFYGERTISGRVWIDRSSCTEKTNVGKGSEHLGSEYRWSRWNGESAEKGTVVKQSSSRKSLTGERGTCCKSGSKASMSGWRRRIEWISSLELGKEEETVRWGSERTAASINQLRSNLRRASGLGSHEEEIMQNDGDRTRVEKSWNESKKNKVTWGCTVETQKPEETVQGGSKKFEFDTGARHSTVQFQDSVDKENQKTDSITSLSDRRNNLQWSCTIKSTDPEEVAEGRTKKSGFKVFLNDSSDVRQIATREQEESMSLEKGESSDADLSLDVDPNDQLDQIVQNERGPSVPSVPFDNSRKITGWTSVSKLEERERVKITNGKLVSQQQDELWTREKLDKMSEKKGEKLIPGMPSDDSRRITRMSSAMKLEPRETIGKNNERLAFQKQDESAKNYGRCSRTELEEGKSLAKENVETASKRFNTLITSNTTSQKLSKESSNSGRKQFSSSVTALEKATSTVGYAKGSVAAHKLLKTSSHTPVCSETYHSVTDENQSARIITQANPTSERLSQTSSCKTEADISKPSGDYETVSKITWKMSNDPSYKLSSNEILQMATESNKKKFAAEIETDTALGKSAQARLSNESDYSSGMVSAEGTENHGLTEKTSDESPLQLRNPQLSSGDFPSEGPSEEVWAIAGWSSREEFEELQFSGKEKLEKDSKTLDSEEPTDKLQKNIDQHHISESEKGQAATSEKSRKVVVKRRSRGIWSSFVEICSRGWGLHEESDNSTLKSASGRPSTESPNSEEWFSVPELEDQECIVKDKRKLAAKRQANVLVSDAGGNTAVVLKESEKTQKGKVQKSAGKWALEASLDEQQLTRRHISSTINKGNEWQEFGKEEITDIITDSKKTQGGQRGKEQNATINQSIEKIAADELQLPSGPVSSGSLEECDQLERDKGKAALVDKYDLYDHEDTERLIQSSESEEKKKMTEKFKQNKQVPKETFISWEKALIVESEQRREDEKFMREALSEARMAADAWEVPVGAVLVQNGRIIARAHNLVEETRDATAHAEMLCIRYASNQLRTWRLAESTLYVTLEPCAMCAGAMLQARIGTVVWGAPNKLLGADGSWVSLFPNQNKEKLYGTSEEPPTAGPVHPFHPYIKIRRGVLASDCSDMMQQFFKLRRKKEKKTQSSSCFSLTNVPSKLFTKLHEIFSMFCI